MKIISPPRAAFLNFPLGHPIGKRFQPELQSAILKDVLSLLETATVPGAIMDLPYTWGEPFTFTPGTRR
jgi:D-proline reductase (dithiol) PrdB